MIKSKNPSKPYIIDCFSYNGEKELLQIRLAVLNSHVDEFWVIWGEETYKGTPKERHEEPQYSDFGKAAHKVKIIKVPRKKWLKNAWHREFYQNAYIGKYKKIWRSKKSNAYIFCSDLDEVWNPALKEELISDCSRSLFGFIKLYLDNFNFYINYKCIRGKEEHISGPYLIRAGSMASYLTRTELRLIAQFKGHKIPHDYDPSGWHWSYVSRDEEFIRKKIAAFSHNEPHVISAAKATAMERVAKHMGIIEDEEEYWSAVSLNNLNYEECDAEFIDLKDYILPITQSTHETAEQLWRSGNSYASEPNRLNLLAYYRFAKKIIRCRVNSFGFND